MDKLTLLMYTNNVEGEPLESTVTNNILANCGSMPIISVSQTPMKFGENICVGKVGNSHHNIFRQVLIGLECIKTPFVLVAESDTLYPPEYFTFTDLTRHHCYAYDNLWVIFFRSPYRYYYKGIGECARIIDRDDWLDYLSRVMKDKPMWAGPEAKHSLPAYCHLRVTGDDHWTGRPAINFRTGKGISSGRSTTEIKEENLPYWGSARELWHRVTGL